MVMRRYDSTEEEQLSSATLATSDLKHASFQMLKKLNEVPIGTILVEEFVINEVSERKAFIRTSRLKNKEDVPIPWRIQQKKIMWDERLLDNIDDHYSRFSFKGATKTQLNRLAVIKIASELRDQKTEEEEAKN